MATQKRPILKEALKDFSDRELLEVLFANQINIFRQLGYLKNKLRTGNEGGHGPYENTVYQLLKDAEEIFKQTDSFLSKEDKADGPPYGHYDGSDEE